MAVDVATYLAQLDDKKGKLERWETDIFQLHHAGVSYQNIADFLKLNGAESTKMEVYRFIHRKKRRHLLVGKPVAPADTEKTRPVAPEKSSTQPPPSPGEESPPQENPSRPKFKFRKGMDKDKTNW
jgi:hypothetical protein